MSPTVRDEARAALGEILDYPGEGLCRRVEDAIGLAAPVRARAAEALREFLASARAMPLGQLQELYTATFDFRPSCSLHAGWHLFGDDGRRGLFLAGLAERYRARGFTAEKELPDHLPVVLRFASAPDAVTEEIVVDAVVPALAAIARELGGSRNPYRHAIVAALALLQPAAGDAAEPLREEARP